ncbi:MAG: hypothetical protein A3F42_05175 [Gammaproteobacteria bacterium RIFCSPHIGHO2_12_FULL_37_34]|nr:MAG: hypothetical protein A3F42_05175 [Gammaproteobacteria bacterium RIFCSPHIGHO2_12_FULL_37_34]
MNSGVLYALLAAILNAFVGVFSLGAFAAGLSAGGVAFYKCLIAFIALSIWIMFYLDQRQACINLLPHTAKIALIAFCGIFLLYFFETRAYLYNNISVVTFSVLGMSTITTFVASQLILKKRHTLISSLGMLLAIIGLFVFHTTSNSHFDFNAGFVFALIAGCGYGLFLVLNKKNPANFHGLAMLWWLLLFGSLFLFLSCLIFGLEIPSLNSLGYIALLGVASTIGGFYCTTKALSLTSATTVQLFELNEPLFASILALIFYKQWLTSAEVIGALLILSGIFISSKEKQPIKVLSQPRAQNS